MPQKTYSFRFYILPIFSICLLMPFVSQLLPIDALISDPYMNGIFYAKLILVSSIIACACSIALVIIWKKLAFKLIFVIAVLLSVGYIAFAQAIQPIILKESTIKSPNQETTVRVLWESRAGDYTTFVLIKKKLGYKSVYSENGALPVSVKWLDNNRFLILDSNTNVIIHKIDLRNIQSYQSELKLNKEAYRLHLNRQIEMLKH